MNLGYQGVSSLWTPGGEHPLPPNDDSRPHSAPPASEGPPNGDFDDQGIDGDPEQVRQAQADLDELRRQLASAPAEAVLANHCYGIFELAALHLSQQPPNLGQARLAIDALAALVEGLKGRLGEEEASLADGLAQLRVAWVQLQTASQRSDGAAD